MIWQYQQRSGLLGLLAERITTQEFGFHEELIEKWHPEFCFLHCKLITGCPVQFAHVCLYDRAF